jgi:hypothetical protein
MAHHHDHTLQRLFAHPTSHNIHWRDVVHLFEHLGARCEETKKDHLKVFLNGKEMSFKIPHAGGHTLEDNHEISLIRKFLKDCGCAPAAEGSH